MLKQRILTALILGPLTLILLFGLTGIFFAIFTALIMMIAAGEWARLAGYKNLSTIGCVVCLAIVLIICWQHRDKLNALLLYAAGLFWLFTLRSLYRYPQLSSLYDSKFMRMFFYGFATLIPCWIGLTLLREQPLWLLYVLLLVWIADIAAYFAGRAWGNKKLAPLISPGKSWAGVYAAFLATSLLSLGASLIFALNWQSVLILLLITALTTAASIVGDLNESVLKRFSHQKDSSHLLPGHGGLLDRIDSLTAAVPIFALCLPWLH